MPRGGTRPGAGRPAARGERKQTLSIRVTPTLRAYLDQCDGSLGDVIEDTLRRTSSFRQWFAEQGKAAR